MYLLAYMNNCTQGRRLVINIGGGKNFCHKHWGGKNFRKIYFQKKIFKSSLQFSKKNSDDLFFRHRQLFSRNVHYSLKMYKFTSFSLYFSFFLSVSAFFHVYFLTFLIIAPHPNY